MCIVGFPSVIIDHPFSARTETAIPVRWTAPEGYEGKHCMESDVWSYAVLLWEVFTNGRLPYHEITTTPEVVIKVCDGVGL